MATPLARSFHPALMLALIAALASCSESSTAPPPPPPPAAPPTMSIAAGDNQNAVAGQAVATKPAVKLVNASGQGVSGISVTFAVATGGGTVQGATQTTGADGVATAAGWTLGTTAGPNTLTATASGTATGSPVTLTATGVAGPAATLTKQAGDNQQADAGAPVPLKPAVKVTDANNNPVAGASVTFAVATGGGSVTGGTVQTGADGVATAGGWTLGAASGTNTLTATVTGLPPLTFTATGQAVVFNPNGNAALAGTRSFTSVNIPAGVTVTVTSDLVLNVSGDATIAGTLIGDCAAITVTANGRLSVTGTVKNGCSVLPAAGGAALRLVGKGGYDFTGAAVQSSGDLTITNDPTLQDADFAPQALPAAAAAHRSSGSPAAKAARLAVCGASSLGSSTAVPPKAPNGVSGQHGTDGKRGAAQLLFCRGDLALTGGVTFTGQAGGDGGDGTHASPTLADASGGRGGDGGLITVAATGSITVIGAGNRIVGGAGGIGGHATATGQPNPAGGKGANAQSRAGDGGWGGLIKFVAKGGPIDVQGDLTLEVGAAGDGGDATSVGADGMDATAAAPAQAGGNARAVAGSGGLSQNKTLTGTNVSGLNSVTVTGGNGGDGGIATGTGGKGGNGNDTSPDGAGGGDLSISINGGNPVGIVGGDGGKAQVKDALGNLVGTGGDGGSANFFNAKGGDGFNGCPLKPGGNGGKGGNTSGQDGALGTGLVNGQNGGVNFNTVADGGKGGNGLGPGKGGNGGTNFVSNRGAVRTIQPSFRAGDPGAPCPGKITRAAAVTVKDDPHGHEPFLKLVGNRNVDVTFGAGTLSGGMSVTGLIPGVALSGEWLLGFFSLSGSGTINGVPNLTVEFDGVLTPTGLTGTITITGTPNGPVTYNVTIPF